MAAFFGQLSTNNFCEIEKSRKCIMTQNSAFRHFELYHSFVSIQRALASLTHVRIGLVNGQELNRKKEIEELCEKGIVPLSADLKKAGDSGTNLDFAAVCVVLRLALAMT